MKTALLAVVIALSFDASAMAITKGSLTLGGIAVSGEGLSTNRSDARSFSFDSGSGCDSGLLSTTGVSSRGDVRVAAGSVSQVRLAPDDDTSCYLSIGIASPGQTGSVSVSISGSNANYVGFDWSSLDAYNVITFIDANNRPVSVSAFGRVLGTAVNGQKIIDAFGLSPNGGVAPGAFVNFDFSGAISRVTVSSVRNNAFELDNLAFGVIAAAPTVRSFAARGGAAPAVVAEPTLVAIFGLSALAMAGARRRRG